MGQRTNHRSNHHHQSSSSSHHQVSRHGLPDDIGRLCDNINSNHDVANSLNRLRIIDASLDVYRRFRVKTLAQKKVNVPGLTDIAKRLVQKIQRLEAEEHQERSTSSSSSSRQWRRRPSYRFDDRSRSDRSRSSSYSGVSFFGAPRASSTPRGFYDAPEGPSGDYNPPRHLELPILSSSPPPQVFVPPRAPIQWAVPAPPAPSPPRVHDPEPTQQPPPQPSVYMQKPAGLLDVSDLENLSEGDYERVRPTLIFLSARELKAFMDKNPKIDAIADGLFRRHCQMDCPEEMWRKPQMYDKWRTLHDVFNNWKLFEEQMDKLRAEMQQPVADRRL